MPVYRLTDELVFPSPWLARKDGLLAVGGDLSEARLLLAYQLGIFPWYSEGDPILWWSPDPRVVLFPAAFRPSRSLRRLLRRGLFSVTADTAFDRVIEACASTRYEGRESTWITPEMLAAYVRLHRAGFAHSVECWRDGHLAGGIYGVSLGRCFFGESMFSAEPNASKVCLAVLVAQAIEWGFALIDGQVHSPHLASLGFREIARSGFLTLLEEHACAQTRRGPWHLTAAP